MLVTSLVQAAAVLVGLRQSMTTAGLDAYIVPYGGQHFDERVAECDARIKAISGFGGSAASVIVTADHALLWTDGRYFLEANLTLEPGWTLMKDGEIGTPSQSEWLNSNSLVKIGVDPKTYPKSSWDKMFAELNGELVATETNLVNDNWPEKPDCPSNPIHQLTVEFAGKSVADKLVDVRRALADEAAQALVVSELEEVAWLLNLRGADLPQASVFFGFVIVRSDKLDIFVNATNIPEAVQNELIALGAEFHPYDNFGTVLEQTLPAVEKIWVSKYANAFVANSVEESRKQLIKLTPIILMKSLKNPVEVEGMRRAHLKDSAAIIAFLSWLEIQLDTAGAAPVSEMSGADKLYTIRNETGEHFVDQSFNTISGFGSNGAVIHYRPTVKTNKNITKDGLYLLDSGGLYWDGTTDITRTVHFGTPTAEQKDRFTRVLKGHIAIATAIFPNKLPGHRLDSFARRALWEINEDYKHGTGHGIGHYLNVHEGPQKMSFGVAVDDSGFQENMFISNEPGFYKDGEYGIRIENIVRIAKSKFEGSLEIETVSFVPIQTKLIDEAIMTQEEIKWVNDYNMACREKVLEYMRTKPDNVHFGPETQDYLTRETNPIGSSHASAPIGFMSNCQFVITASIVTYIAQLLLA